MNSSTEKSSTSHVSEATQVQEGEISKKTPNTEEQIFWGELFQQSSSNFEVRDDHEKRENLGGA